MDAMPSYDPTTNFQALKKLVANSVYRIPCVFKYYFVPVYTILPVDHYQYSQTHTEITAVKPLEVGQINFLL